MLLSGLLGLERAVKGRAAGLRTHILIATGAALFMIISIETARAFSGPAGGPDPTRIAAQVVSGIGFLGAGAILRNGMSIKGLTTAADIWVVAAIGLSVGAGFFIPAAMVTAAALFVLVVLGRVEKKFIPESSGDLIIIYLANGFTGLDGVKKILMAQNISSINISLRMRKGQRNTLKVLAKLPRPLDIEALASELKNIGQVDKVEMRIQQTMK
ncbi:MAG: MgtC/SapB family protein [Spirochaetales bacterium]|nr:MAG: MgtC/SapB family protein [Spirochaetales bacterium]